VIAVDVLVVLGKDKEITALCLEEYHLMISMSCPNDATPLPSRTPRVSRVEDAPTKLQADVNGILRGQGM
jgi:hypothetical protein